MCDLLLIFGSIRIEKSAFIHLSYNECFVLEKEKKKNYLDYFD